MKIPQFRQWNSAYTAFFADTLFRGITSSGLRYVYTSILQATRKGNFSLSPAEAAALAFLKETAGRTDIVLEMMMEPGDMQFCFNHTILHSRTEFEEWDEPDRRRHLLRLWLNIPNGRKLAPEFADRYGAGTGMGVPPPSGQVQANMRH